MIESKPQHAPPTFQPYQFYPALSKTGSPPEQIRGDLPTPDRLTWGRFFRTAHENLGASFTKS